MASRFPSVGVVARELALTMVGRLLPALEDDIRARFDNRREYARTPTSQQEALALANNRGNHGNRRAPSPSFFDMFRLLFLRFFMGMAGQALLLSSCSAQPTVHEFLQILFSLPLLLDVRVSFPTADEGRPQRAPYTAFVHFLVVFAGNYLPMVKKKVLRIMPSVQPGLHDVLNSLMAPAIALDANHFMLDNPSVQLDRKFFDAGTSKDKQRVLRDLAKFFVKLQNFLGAGGSSMSAEDKGKTVSALVAAKIATLRTRGLFSVKVNALLAPVLDVSKLLRHRAGTEKTSERRQVYLLGILFRRSVAMEEVLEQALWTRNWPVISDELATIANLLSTKTGTTANKTAAAPAVLYVRGRNASATIDPRATHLRGSGAVVAK